ncbi:MAG: GerMN domain-containing protein [bacterium]|nr:GerMN domain-containing protein [bacterium]
MIKKYAVNKITVTTMCLFLLLMFYLIPIPNNEITPINNENTENKIENIVYLLDEDNYVSRVVSYYDKTTIEDAIRDKIDILTYGLVGYEKFYSLIPKNTKLNSLKVDKDNVYLDFSKELLEVSKYLEEEMIESIVYTLTEINGINNIYITVENEKLDYLPNSKKSVPYPLTKEIGINKEYDIDSFNNINKTTIIFTKTLDNYSYYVPVTKITNKTDEKIDIIIEELKSGVNSQNNLNGFVSENVILEKYDILDDKISLVFNNYIFNDINNNTILEEVKYVISESIFENYDVKEVVFNTKDEKNICNVVKK